ncbi:FMN-dependent NADH-azoreductase [Saccharothrix texasensis]|uniref:FMN dependent NADH:quinone oxidoreductase n=1 Tax=Saccharothrix texasensis TaxID=103734 RepID=A0A3N1H6A4_9PSEU|nr:NAD(P)H-dependent oxidoreductase [Saccharothrix texasensis]ROP38029.1 FMN-dependent NADH-azoreductase [Saccharothrix texasensis]
MAHLLHIDTSLRFEGSVSREVSGAFAEAWRSARPDGGYTYRDLAADPLPHVDPAALATREADGDRPLERRLVAEVKAADTLLLGVPMYNYGVPSSLKAWLDWVMVPELFADQQTGEGVLTGKRVVVVTARGGSYAPGTPRHPFDFQEPYLRAVFGMVGLDRDLEFVHAELTLAGVVPHMAQFRELAVASLEDAHRVVRELAVA